MSVRVVTRITVAAPPTAVFSYLSNLEYHRLWNPQVQSFSASGILERGSSYETTSLLFGITIRSRNKVTKCRPPHQLTIENDTGQIHYKADFQLLADADKTVVVCTTDVSAESKSFAFAKPVMKLLARRELQTDLQALKIAVELILR
jgi:carbon monoxide dehydrogenase subunit G